MKGKKDTEDCSSRSKDGSQQRVDNCQSPLFCWSCLKYETLAADCQQIGSGPIQ